MSEEILFCITQEDVKLIAERMGIDPEQIDWESVKTVLEWGIDITLPIKDAINNSVTFDTGFSTRDFCSS